MIPRIDPIPTLHRAPTQAGVRAATVRERSSHAQPVLEPAFTTAYLTEPVVSAFHPVGYLWDWSTSGSSRRHSHVGRFGPGWGRGLLPRVECRRQPERNPWLTAPTNPTRPEWGGGSCHSRPNRSPCPRAQTRFYQTNPRRLHRWRPRRTTIWGLYPLKTRFTAPVGLRAQALNYQTNPN